MRSYSLFIRFTNYSPKVTYHVEVFRQPLPRYLVARAYDWYSLRAFKIPGFRRFDSWHHRRFGKGDWTFIPISARQDIRAHFLREKGKNHIVTVEIDEDTYVKIGGRAVSTEA